MLLRAVREVSCHPNLQQLAEGAVLFMFLGWCVPGCFMFLGDAVPAAVFFPVVQPNQMSNLNLFKFLVS